MAGLVLGLAAKRVASAGAGDDPAAVVSDESGLSPQIGGTSRRSRTGAAEYAMAPLPHSTDTLASILTIEDTDGVYRRMTLWLLDASGEDIASFWQHYRDFGTENYYITQLIMINWARLDPRAALIATVGTRHEEDVWRAWACHDPAAALAAVRAEKPEFVSSVARAVGNFRSGWLRDHLDSLSSSVARDAVIGIQSGGQDPLTIIDLMSKGGVNSGGLIRDFARKDPWAAYQWVLHRDSEFATEIFVETLANDHPEVLERIAVQLPEGELGLKIDAALFANLVKSDPEAAAKLAMDDTAPHIRSQRQALLGVHLAASDPSRAFELAESMLAIDSDALLKYREDYDIRRHGHRAVSPEAALFMKALLDHDPERVMEMVSPQQSETFHHLGRMWATSDVAGYVEWVNHLTNPDIRQMAAPLVIERLQSDWQYAEAVEWCMSLPDSINMLHSVYHRWREADPARADGWLATVELSEADMNIMRTSREGGH